MPEFDLGLIMALAALVTALGGGIAGLVKGKHDGASITRQAVESAQAFWQVTLEAQNARLAEQEARIRELEATASNADRMQAHLISIHDWIDRGAKPPPPTRPTWVPPGPFAPQMGVSPAEDD